MTTLTQPWTRLYGDIKIDLPGVADAVIQQQLFSCFKDFVEQTNIWQETVPITALPAVTSYPFVLAGEGNPKRLLMLYDPALTAQSTAPRWVQFGVGMQVPGVIDVSYAPSTQTTWAAIIAKTLKDETDTNNWPVIDEDDFWIVDTYRDGLHYGVIARLQRQPAKPYTNATLSAANQLEYKKIVGRARTDALKQNAFGAQAWGFPQGFASINRKGWN